MIYFYRQVKRRRAEIAEIEQAYVAGLGAPKFLVWHGGESHTSTNVGAGDGTSPVAAAALITGTSPRDQYLDIGAGNRWASSDAARMALYYSLEAGAVAHLSLKTRAKEKALWVKVKAAHVTAEQIAGGRNEIDRRTTRVN